jgi:hypothetical protein
MNLNPRAEGADEGIQALYKAVELAHGVLSNVESPLGSFVEFHLCQGLIGEKCTEAGTKNFIRRHFYSHRSSSSAAIGAVYTVLTEMT